MTRRVSTSLLVVLPVALAAGCATVGPDYVRPDLAVPDGFRGEPVPAAALAVAPAASIADEPWPTVFPDEPLRGLIATALEQNHDLAIAAARLLQAEAAYGITRADQFPNADARSVAQGQRSSVGTSDGEARTSGVMQIGGAVSWPLDFWGRYRRATEAARADILASEWGRRAVMTSLVSGVASSYYTLLALDLELAIAERTAVTREESLRLTQVREAGGATSLVDVRQAEQLVHGARAAIVDLRRAIEQQENFISTLVGRYPGPIPRGRPIGEQALRPEVPAGLSSTLLERRPDIRRAEQALAAANADIGVARSAYFPHVTLTGSGGMASTALSALFSGPAAAWTAAASLVQPVFTAGRTRSNVALAEARQQEATVAYAQTVQAAFREVSDALVEYRRTRELGDEQRQLVAAAQDARRLAELRYEGGAASYLEVLDSDTRLFEAERQLARVQRAALASYVEIYRALGGGWR